jgi:N6-adenosine-specific RNA methylase IME4
MTYSLIYADPPWQYGNNASNGAAKDHYDTMSMADLKRLPVWALAEENAVLAMWYTGTHNREAIELAEAWGFTVRTMKGFTWVKLNALAEQHINKALDAGDVLDFYDFLDLLNSQTRMNGGNHTRANTEDLLIATRGRGLSVATLGLSRLSTAHWVSTARNPPKRATALNGFMATCGVLSCSAAVLFLAGTTGAIRQLCQQFNCCRVR